MTARPHPCICEMDWGRKIVLQLLMVASPTSLGAPCSSSPGGCAHARPWSGWPRSRSSTPFCRSWAAHILQQQCGWHQRGSRHSITSGEVAAVTHSALHTHFYTAQKAASDAQCLSCVPYPLKGNSFQRSPALQTKHEAACTVPIHPGN